MAWSLTDGLTESSCDALLVVAESSEDPDLAPFVGRAHLGQAFLILDRGSDGRLAYLTPMERDEAASTGLDLLDPGALEVDALRARYGATAGFWASVLRRGLRLTGATPGRLALAGRAALGPVHRALVELESDGWRFTDGSSLLRRHRKRKSAVELDEIRRSARGACDAFHRVAEILASAEVGDDRLRRRGVDLTVGVLRREISISLAAHGLSEPHGNILALGASAAVPHTKGADADLIRPGTTLVIDLFPKGALYADCTRTFCIGEPSEDVQRSFSLVREALADALRTARPGTRAWDLQQATCSLFDAAGVPTPITAPGTTRGYVHGLGHGVGFELHEYPSFRKGAGPEGVLEAGDVLTLEPGLYDEDAGYGVRLEDLCVVTENGLENLTPLPYELDPRLWAR